MERTLLKPVVSVAGNMSSLVFTELDKRKPSFSGVLREPCGGTLVFSLNNPGTPCHAFESNRHMLNVHNAVKHNHEELEAKLAMLDAAYNALAFEAKKDFYIKLRNQFNSAEFGNLPSVEQAAIFSCLIKLAFNSLFRTNSKGRINVPFGNKNKATICDEKNICAAHTAMADINVEIGSYEKVVDYAGADDFVLLRPAPFAGGKKAAEAALLKLVDVFTSLDGKGVKTMLVIADSDEHRELFDGFCMDTVTTRSSISATSAGRGKKDLLVITNYPSPVASVSA